MASEPSLEERKRAFIDFLASRLFGIVATVDRPSESELWPMASGIVFEVEGDYVLLTAGHYVTDLIRWEEEGRLDQLALFVNDRFGGTTMVPLQLGQLPHGCHDTLDIGFFVLDHDLVSDIVKKGGRAIRTEQVGSSIDSLKRFYLVGFASACRKLISETIATAANRSWELTGPSACPVTISPQRLEGQGDSPYTYRFVPVTGLDDYSGTSGGPIFGYAQEAQIQDYCLFAIQSKQIRAASSEQKPKALIATSAELAIRTIKEFLRSIKSDESPES